MYQKQCGKAVSPLSSGSTFPSSPTPLSESSSCWIETYRSRGAIWACWGRPNDACTAGCNAVYDGNNSSNTVIMTVVGVIVVHRVLCGGLLCVKITLSLSQRVAGLSMFRAMILSAQVCIVIVCEHVYLRVHGCVCVASVWDLHALVGECVFDSRFAHRGERGWLNYSKNYNVFMLKNNIIITFFTNG